MERIFIDREWCVSYVLLALNSINYSANDEITVNDLTKEIEAMFEIYKDENVMKNKRKILLRKLGKKRIKFD